MTSEIEADSAKLVIDFQRIGTSAYSKKLVVGSPEIDFCLSDPSGLDSSSKPEPDSVNYSVT